MNNSWNCIYLKKILETFYSVSNLIIFIIVSTFATVKPCIQLMNMEFPKNFAIRPSNLQTQN